MGKKKKPQVTSAKCSKNTHFLNKYWETSTIHTYVTGERATLANTCYSSAMMVSLYWFQAFHVRSSQIICL